MFARIVRIPSDQLRTALVAACFAPLMLKFAASLAWNDPRRFFTVEPWAFSWGMFKLAAAGFFVGMPIRDE